MSLNKITDLTGADKTDKILIKTVNHSFKVIEPVTRLTNYVAIGVLSLMMFFTAIDVLLRYLFNKPIPGDMELTQFMMAVVVSAAVGYCGLQKGHIIVDILFNKLSLKGRAIFNVFHYLVGAILFALICWRTALEGVAVQSRNLTSAVLLIPVFPFYWIVAFGCAVLCLAWLFIAIESISEVSGNPERKLEAPLPGGE
jgi:TRAP-type transport system small permease protein